MIRYLNLPKIPDEIIQRIDTRPENRNPVTKAYSEIFKWDDAGNEEVHAWCRDNICKDMYFAFQYMLKDMPMHIDQGTKIKLNYLIVPGGEDAITRFYDENKNLTHEVKVEPFRWHLLDGSVYHAVDNIDADKYRFAITGRIFPV